MDIFIGIIISAIVVGFLIRKFSPDTWEKLKRLTRIID